MKETDLLFTKEPKKPSPCAKKTETIHEKLRKIKEQLDAIPILDLTVIEQNQATIMENQAKLDAKLNFIQTTLNIRDEEDRGIMDFLKKKAEKET